MTRFTLPFLLAFIVLAWAPRASAQTVVAIDAATSLDDRFATAMDRAGNRTSWIVFSFEKSMCEGCFTGSFKWDSEWERSIEDVILGREPAGESVQGAVRRTLRSMDDDADDYNRMVVKDIAVMIRMENGAIASVHHANMTSAYPFEDDRVFWLGKHAPEHILSLIDHRQWDRWQEEARKGWIWTIGSLAMDPGTLNWLGRAYDLETESEVRKAIAYAYGNLDSEQAVSALQRIITGDSSREVQKAAIYALGSNDTDAAREALLKIIWEMGASSSS